jgi:hypothetical protein
MFLASTVMLSIPAQEKNAFWEMAVTVAGMCTLFTASVENANGSMLVTEPSPGITQLL